MSSAMLYISSDGCSWYPYFGYTLLHLPDQDIARSRYYLSLGNAFSKTPDPTYTLNEVVKFLPLTNKIKKKKDKTCFSVTFIRRTHVQYFENPENWGFIVFSSC
jgi:hypothetical protein